MFSLLQSFSVYYLVDLCRIYAVQYKYESQGTLSAGSLPVPGMLPYNERDSDRTVASACLYPCECQTNTGLLIITLPNDGLDE